MQTYIIGDILDDKTIDLETKFSNIRPGKICNIHRKNCLVRVDLICCHRTCYFELAKLLSNE